MKKFITLCLMTLSSSLFAASVTVPQFEIDFYIDKSAYDLDFELEMACRYEKFVISDSAQYEYTYKKVPLQFKTSEASNGLSKVTLVNPRSLRHELTGWFKSGKKCQTYMNFFLVDKKYSIGWAGKFDRPIRLGLFEHSRLAEEKTFDVHALRDLIENKKLSFNYKDVRAQINVSFAFDDVSSRDMSTYIRTSAARDPETQMPYKLQSKF